MMHSTKNRGFFSKCSFCLEEYSNCQESFRNQNVVYENCHKTFTLVEYQSDAQKQSLEGDMKFREGINQLIATFEHQHTNFNKGLKKIKFNLQVEHPTLLLKDDVIQCTEKLQLEDQENSHIKSLEDKIAKLQQNKKKSR